MTELAPIRIYKCDYCGLTGPWGDTWSWRLILHRKGQWDEYLHACGDNCRKALDARTGYGRKKPRSFSATPPRTEVT